MRFRSSTTTPEPATVRDTPAAKLPAMPPSEIVGVTTVIIGASTGSRLIASITFW